MHVVWCFPWFCVVVAVELLVSFNKKKSNLDNVKLDVFHYTAWFPSAKLLGLVASKF